MSTTEFRRGSGAPVLNPDIAWYRVTWAWILLGLAATLPVASAQVDLTKGEALPTDAFLALGSTGAIGKMETAAARQILVSAVKNDSPAAGKLQPGDVILGVESPPASAALSGESCTRPECVAAKQADSCGHFRSDARRVLAEAITAAEAGQAGGKIVLLIWRPAGATGQGGQPGVGGFVSVPLELTVLGTYSSTSPWECAKTEVIIDKAARHIVDHSPFFKKNRQGTTLVNGDIDAMLDALGLLATGEAKYVAAMQPFVRELAKDLDGPNPNEEQGLPGPWVAGYRLVLLTEYYLATKDEAVLPAIDRLATHVAEGQSGVGTWGHGYANRQYPTKPESGYGAMNQCSLVCATGLVLARKCGIDKPVIRDAVDLSLRFYRYYVDKGCIPYGDHPPARYHDHNGRMSIAAVLFDLVGDAKSAEYFARSTLASWNDREVGHTGHYFAWQWGALGAARGGDAAARAFIDRTRWFTELERRHDGSSSYQPQLRGDHKKYFGWSTTGSRLVQHCLPRKTLFIMGKGGTCVSPFTDDMIEECFAAKTFDPAGLSVADLLGALGNRSVLVRAAAAQELGRRDENAVAPLVAMLDSENRYARYGACLGLHFAGRGSEQAVDRLIQVVTQDPDLTMRYYAVIALRLPPPGGRNQPAPASAGLGEAAKKAFPALIELVATYGNEQDPTNKLPAHIAGSLFDGTGIGYSRRIFSDAEPLAAIDRGRLVAAMKKWLTNPNGSARTDASRALEVMPEAELDQLWSEVYDVIKIPASSAPMFAVEGRANAIRAMADHHIQEGLEAGSWFVFELKGWGQKERLVRGVPALIPYGQLLEPRFADLDAIVSRFANDARERRKIEPAVEKIKDTPPPTLRSFRDNTEE